MGEIKNLGILQSLLHSVQTRLDAQKIIHIIVNTILGLYQYTYFSEPVVTCNNFLKHFVILKEVMHITLQT